MHNYLKIQNLANVFKRHSQSEREPRDVIVTSRTENKLTAQVHLFHGFKLPDKG